MDGQLSIKRGGIMRVKKEVAHYTCDQVAECIDGVSEELYKALWNIVCAHESEGHEHYDFPCRVTIKECWHMLDPEMQKQVNELQID